MGAQFSLNGSFFKENIIDGAFKMIFVQKCPLRHFKATFLYKNILQMALLDNIPHENA